MNALRTDGPLGAVVMFARTLFVLIGLEWIYQTVQRWMNARDYSLPDFAIEALKLLGVFWVYEQGWVRLPTTPSLSIGQLFQSPDPNKNSS